MKNVKPYIIYGFAALLLLAMTVLLYGIRSEVSTPVMTSYGSFGEVLWTHWGVTIIIVSFILFAGGAGILVLLGGGWRWE